MMGDIVTDHCRQFSSRRRAAAGALAALLAAACRLLPAPAPAPAISASPGTLPQARYLRASWDRLPPIADAQWIAAWPAWIASCSRLSPDAVATSQASSAHQGSWRAACEHASLIDRGNVDAIRRYLKSEFDLYRIQALTIGADAHDAQPAAQTDDKGLITGYYEPLLQGSRSPDARFSVPLFRVPPDLVRVEVGGAYPQLQGLKLRGRLDNAGPALRLLPYWSREEIDRLAPLKGEEIVWVDDALEAFSLQVQGSGRIQLRDGSQIRLSYADTNGWPYRSIGRWLVENGELSLEKVYMPAIRRWIRAHPERLPELLHRNPSVVFFRETEVADERQGPVGALGAALTPGYSVAIDPRYVPLGALLIIETRHPVSGGELLRPVLAQDTGGAIRGPLRLDLFWGHGEDAETAAGRQHEQAAVWLAVPRGQNPEDLVQSPQALP